MCPTLWWVFFVFICRLVNVSAYNKSIEIYPQYATLKPNGNLNVTCTNGEDLFWCQFRIRYQNTTMTSAEDGPVLQFWISNSKIVSENYPRNRTAPYDAVAELRGKECRLQLSNVSEGRYLVGCRIHTWSYNILEGRYMGLYVDEEADEFESKKTDKNMIQNVAYGDDNAEIVFELEDSNYFTEPCKLEESQNVTFRKDQLPSLNKDKTKCTLPILANDAANGPVWITAKTTSEGIVVTRRYMRIIVVKKPQRITLSSWLTPHNDGPEEEILLTAICGVYESEYQMYISWSLMNGTENVLPYRALTSRNSKDEWTWPWVKKFLQAPLAATIQPSDTGKTLTCSITFGYYQDYDWRDVLTTKKEVVLTLNGKRMIPVLQTPDPKASLSQTP